MTLNPNCLQGQAFVEKLVPMIEGLLNAGFSREETLRALGAQQFVADFVDTPEWFVAVDKLPKGYKWSDGKRYHLKAAKNQDAENYVFLIIEDDLYIKDLFKADSFTISKADGVHWYKAPAEYAKRICVIKHWKEMNLNYINLKLNRTRYFQTSLLDFGHKNGGRAGFTQPILKDFRGES